MNIENAVKLADLLEADARSETGMRFDIDYVGKNYSAIDENFFDADEHFAALTRWTPGADCGTMGCALGLAALSGAFPSLTFEKAGYRPKTRIDLYFEGVETDFVEAGARLLDVSPLTSRKLFDPEFYRIDVQKGSVGELEVAARLRYLLKNGNLLCIEKYSGPISALG